MNFSRILILVLVIMTIVIMGCESKPDNEQPRLTLKHAIPIQGNSWVADNPAMNRGLIGEQGIVNWKDSSVKIRTYVRVEKTGELHVGLMGKVKDGSSKINVTLGDQTREVTISNIYADTIAAGIFEVSNPGYHWVEIEGLSKSGET